MVWHFKAIYEGYLTLMTAPLPRHYLSTIPIADQVKGAGFRADEIAKLPVSGPFKFESVTPQAELRLARNDNYANPRTGKPANLDSIIFKWYGDPDAMIAGFRADEIDIAFDLQDSDIPKVQDLGDQVAAIPALLYEFLRPNWSPGPFSTTGDHPNTGGCSRNAAVADRGTGCPTADPAIRQAISLRDRQGRDQHPPPRRQRPGREHEHQPGRLVLRGPDPGDVRSRQGQLDPRRGRLGQGSGRLSLEGRPEGQDRALHDHPRRSARTPWR